MDIEKTFKEYRASCRFISNTIPKEQVKEQLRHQIARGIEDDMVQWFVTDLSFFPHRGLGFPSNTAMPEYQMDATITIAKPGFLRELQSVNHEFMRLKQWEEDLQNREKKFKALKRDLLEINRLTRNVNELFRKTK